MSKTIETMSAVLEEEKRNVESMQQALLEECRGYAAARESENQQSIQRACHEVDDKCRQMTSDFEMFLAQKTSETEQEILRINSEVESADDVVSSYIDVKETEFQRFASESIEAFRMSMMTLYNPHVM